MTLTVIEKPDMINPTGPQCERCGVRPDDPMVVDTELGRSRLCLGCVCDLRALGIEVLLRFTVSRVGYFA